MRNLADLFPTTIATGEAFCNRVKERELLKQYVKHGRHTVLIAPRRYGKTSLINQVLLELKVPYSVMELTMATSASDIEHIIIKHISTLLHSILPRTSKAKQTILKLFNWLNPELVLTVGGQKLIFHPERSKRNSVDNISEILKKLDAAAALTKKRVVVVMDEFQQITDIKNHTIEASIRHAMQYSKHVSYVFSGSNRHMLISMFNNKNRPFYNSCEIMKIERISENDYEKFIQSHIHKRWHKLLPDNVLEKIFNLTELHSSYVNLVCGYFWVINEFPTLEHVEEYWVNFVNSKRPEFSEDILSLSKNQKKVISYLASNPTTHPGSHEVCNSIGLSEASIRQAIRKLMLKDYIYKNSKGIIQVLDPAFKDYIKGLMQ